MDLTLTPRLLIHIKTIGIVRNMIPPLMPFGMFHTAASPAIAAMKAAKLMEYVNLRGINRQTSRLRARLGSQVTAVTET